MIKKIYLCGHTGSVNRGCEAILRSTAFILNQCKVSDVTALTFDKQYDEMLRVGEVLDLQSYPKRSALLRAVSKVRRKWFHDGVWGSRYYYYGLFENIKKNSIVFNVGGDTYCYGDPHISYALNELAQENDVPNVFWGCSVDEKVLTNKRMQEDINRYSYIVVRESLSKNILEKIVKEPKKILYACDPAFQLPIKETTLPENFLEGNTVGINLSPLVFRDYKDENDMMHQNVNVLIDYILQNTDMNVCLIPHVYNVEQHTQDIDVAGRIYERFRQTGRVSLVDTELSCVELKYIISKCRFCGSENPCDNCGIFDGSSGDCA